MDWLEANRPPPPRPVLCHGDFHPLNLLVRGGEITGILDWANFGIGDPMSDVACTLLLLTIYGRHVHDLAEADRFGSAYARAYAARRRLDRDRLDYHRVRHAVTTLVNGADGRSPVGPCGGPVRPGRADRHRHRGPYRAAGWRNPVPRRIVPLPQ